MEAKQISQKDYEQYQKLLAKEQKQKEYSRRVAVKTQLILEKAKAAGIQVSKDEIDARIAKEDGTVAVVIQDGLGL